MLQPLVIISSRLSSAVAIACQAANSASGIPAGAANFPATALRGLLVGRIHALLLQQFLQQRKSSVSGCARHAQLKRVPDPFGRTRIGTLGENTFRESARGIDVNRIVEQCERLQRRVPVNGVKLQGIVTWFDNFCLLLRRDGMSQLVYKHAISTIMPGGPITLFDEESGGA